MPTLQYQHLAEPLSVSADSVFVDKWIGYNPQPYAYPPDPRARQSGNQFTEIPDPHQDLELDRWFSPTQQPYPYPQSRHALGVFVLHVTDSRENVTLDKWFAETQQPYAYPPDRRARQTGAVILMPPVASIMTPVDGAAYAAVTVTREAETEFRAAVEVTRELESSLALAAVDAEAGAAVPLLIDLVDEALRSSDLV